MSDDKARWLAENLLGRTGRPIQVCPRCHGEGHCLVDMMGFEQDRVCPVCMGSGKDGGICYGDLKTGNGMLSIINAMRERGFDFRLDAQGSYFEAPGIWAEFTNMKLSQSFRAETDTSIPAAVIEAAYAALQEQDDDKLS